MKELSERTRVDDVLLHILSLRSQFFQLHATQVRFEPLDVAVEESLQKHTHINMQLSLLNMREGCSSISHIDQTVMVSSCEVVDNAVALIQTRYFSRVLSFKVCVLELGNK